MRLTDSDMATRHWMGENRVHNLLYDAPLIAASKGKVAEGGKRTLRQFFWRMNGMPITWRVTFYAQPRESPFVPLRQYTREIEAWDYEEMLSALWEEFRLVTVMKVEKRY